jgi:transcriptional regulator with PAS, ATPase and Fis domain
VLFDEIAERPTSLQTKFLCFIQERGFGNKAELKDFEREHILRVVAESRTLEQAAATLGINVTTLWRKRRRYGIG